MIIIFGTVNLYYLGKKLISVGKSFGKTGYQLTLVPWQASTADELIRRCFIKILKLQTILFVDCVITKISDIDQHLLKLLETIAGVQYFEPQCRYNIGLPAGRERERERENSVGINIT